jgi:CHASE3 domain sensor protein
VSRQSEPVQTIAFAAILTVFSLLAAVASVSASKSAEASKWVDHTNQVIETLHRITVKLFAADWAQRGYLLTGANEHLKLRDDAFNALDKEMETAARLTADNAGQQLRVQQLRALLAERERLARVNEQVRKREGLTAVPALVSGVSPLVDSMGALVTQMGAEENHLLEVRGQTEASRLLATRASFIVLVAMLLGVVFALFWRIRDEFGCAIGLRRQSVQVKRC